MPDAEVLIEALGRLDRGDGKVAGISVTVPAPLVDALRSLSASGRISSTSAAVTEAVRSWASNQLLREALDEIYEDEPQVRPSEAAVASARRRLGL